MLASSVAITTSQQPSSAALPAKQKPAAIPTSGAPPDEAREVLERPAVEARDDRHVAVAGPSAAALGEQHHRQTPPLRDLEQPVLLHVPAHALRAGEHHVVVGEHRAVAAVDLARPPTRPSAGVLAISSSRGRRRSWAA